MTLLQRGGLLALVVLASGCADGPTEVGPGEEGRPVVQASLTGTVVRRRASPQRFPSWSRLAATASVVQTTLVVGAGDGDLIAGGGFATQDGSPGPRPLGTAVGPLGTGQLGLRRVDPHE
jgi:hypothetical protein